MILLDIVSGFGVYFSWVWFWFGFLLFFFVGEVLTAGQLLAFCVACPTKCHGASAAASICNVDVGSAAEMTSLTDGAHTMAMATAATEAAAAVAATK